jgi:hypothetical protein
VIERTVQMEFVKSLDRLNYQLPVGAITSFHRLQR